MLPSCTCQNQGVLLLSRLSTLYFAADGDVASAAAAAAGRECTLEGDHSSLFYAASALLKLQHMYGLIPRLQVRC
jgi:hypothetical protein